MKKMDVNNLSDLLGKLEAVEPDDEELSWSTRSENCENGNSY
ncbi:hypothetical protein [Lactobacillus crispatus]|uniref:Uncharacterized protein n=1 Tax=Lactobacillus crispatus TaxID=47770 RepID=A0AAW6XLT6_9LACO|nr:hypothetical protein [Lactobacillus crispatus]MDK6503157.1 hypothetical protein [Lactobacillus crispatus]